jgi:hypothetical protein
LYPGKIVLIPKQIKNATPINNKPTDQLQKNGNLSEKETNQTTPKLVSDSKTQQNISKDTTEQNTKEIKKEEDKEIPKISKKTEHIEDNQKKEDKGIINNDGKVNEKQSTPLKQEESKAITKSDYNATSLSTQETTPVKTEQKEEAKVPTPSARGRYVEVSLKEISHGTEVSIILKEIQKANYLRCML